MLGEGVAWKDDGKKDQMQLSQQSMLNQEPMTPILHYPSNHHQPPFNQTQNPITQPYPIRLQPSYPETATQHRHPTTPKMQSGMKRPSSTLSPEDVDNNKRRRSESRHASASFNYEAQRRLHGQVGTTYGLGPRPLGSVAESGELGAMNLSSENRRSVSSPTPVRLHSLTHQLPGTNSSSASISGPTLVHKSPPSLAVIIPSPSMTPVTSMKQPIPLGRVGSLNSTESSPLSSLPSSQPLPRVKYDTSDHATPTGQVRSSAESRYRPEPRAQSHIQPLPPLPLLHHLSRQTLEECRTILQLYHLPTYLLIPTLNENLPLITKLGLSSSNPPTKAQLFDAYARRQELAVELLMVAWKQEKTPLSMREKVEIGLEVGELGLDLLTTLQGELEDAERNQDRESGFGYGTSLGEMNGSGKPLSSSSELGRIKAEESSRSRPSSPYNWSTSIPLGRADSTSSLSMPQAYVATASTSTPRSAGGKGKVELGVEYSDTWRETKLRDIGRWVKDIEDILGESLAVSSKLSHTSVAAKIQHCDLIILLAKLSHRQGSVKYAIKEVKKVKQEIGNDLTYSAILYKILFLLVEWDTGKNNRDVPAALNHLSEVMNIATKRKDTSILMIATTERARIIMSQSYFDLLPDALKDCARSLPVSLSWEARMKEDKSWDVSGIQLEKGLMAGLTPLEVVILIHYLIMRMVWEIRLGTLALIPQTLMVGLHRVMDTVGPQTDAAAYDYRVAIHSTAIGGRQPQNLNVKLTPNNVLLEMVFHASCLCQFDVLGKKPKRFIFASAGLECFECPLANSCWEIKLPWSAGMSYVKQAERTLMGLKADILLDVAGFHIARSEFTKSDEVLSTLVQHLRETSNMNAYGPHLCFLLAQRYHILGQTSIARKHYLACEFSSGAGSEINLLAKVSLLCLELAEATEEQKAGLMARAQSLAKVCLEMGSGVFQICAGILGCVSEPLISTSKACLSAGLLVAMSSGNTQARALVLGFASIHYRKTRETNSLMMIVQAQQLAAGIGNVDESGNRLGPTGLGLWLAGLHAQLIRPDDAAAQEKLQRRLAKLLDKQEKEKVYRVEEI